MKAPNWESWKLAHAYPRIGSGTTPTSTSDAYYSVEEGVPWVTTAELRENYIEKTASNVTKEALQDFSALRIYKPGSLMIAMYGATIGRLGITTMPSTCNQACCVFECSEQFDNRFLFYWLWHRRSDLIALSTGGGQPNLSQQDLREERAYCPPIETQRRIAQFLDEKTARIDGLIEKKRALLDRLAEKRQALITRAVTKGLNPDAAMKPSGIDWLGDIPAHWVVKQLRYSAKNLNRMRVPIAAEQRKGIERTYPYYGASGIIDYVDEYIFDFPTVLVAEDGANLLSRSTPLSFVAEGKYWVNNHAHILLPQSMTIWFCSALLAMYPLDPYISGSAQPKLTRDNLSSLRVWEPPLDEQLQIEGMIRAEISEIDLVEGPLRHSVETLVEYRAALITAAVTGQIGGLQ